MKDLLLDRRTFLESIGLLGASSMVSCQGAPLEELHAYLTPAPELVPGKAAYYATICRACPAGCGLHVKTREARPIKLEGNPVHPVNQGALCARGQAFIDSLYSKARLQVPVIRKNANSQDVSWDTALTTVTEKMRQARSIAVLSGLQSGSLPSLLDELLQKCSRTHEFLMYEPIEHTSLKFAANALFGLDEVPRYDLSAAEYVVSLGADVLDTYLSPVEFARQWAQGRGASSTPRMHLDYVGPRRNLTASAADRWSQASPHAMTEIALRIAYDVVALRRQHLGAEQLNAVETTLRALGPRPTSTPLGDDVHTDIAQKLLATPHPVILCGGVDVRTASTTRMHAAVLLANHVLGVFGSVLRFGDDFVYSKLASTRQTQELLQRSGQDVDVLFVIGSNLAYHLPGAAEQLQRAKFVVYLGSEANETSALAHVVLPIHHALESWGDYEVSAHVRGLMQPVRAPLYASRHLGDVLMTLFASLGTAPVATSFRHYLVRRWAQIGSDANVERQGQSSWEKLLVEGGLFGQPETTAMPTLSATAVEKLNLLPTDTKPGTGLTLVVAASAGLGDGQGALSTWLHELPDALTQTAWEVPLEISVDVAAHLACQDGDRVSVSAQKTRLEVRVLVDKELPQQTAVLRMGGGRVGNDVQMPGVNAMQFLDGHMDEVSGELLTVRRNGLEIGRLGDDHLVRVSGGTDSKGRLLALAVSEQQVARGEIPVITRHGEVPAHEHKHNHKSSVPMPHQEEGGTMPHDNIVKLQEHNEHRWGMTVDLDRCTGCGACVVACRAENNIPVVGRDEVSRGRELDWLRIEKHEFESQPQVRFLPVMCQHCDNAPCEPVCPVFASYHTPDGLNAQIYNRCVGTRYCSNNCPYKARRFNYFKYEHEQPANQQLNPDVTVRSRGVMEKCTMCMQRIREVTNRAKAEGRDVRDGEIMPACAQTCPTGAILFGDYKQSTWRMSTLAQNSRGYRLLDYAINTRPGIVYLRRVFRDKKDA